MVDESMVDDDESMVDDEGVALGPKNSKLLNSFLTEPGGDNTKGSEGDPSDEAAPGKMADLPP